MRLLWLILLLLGGLLAASRLSRPVAPAPAGEGRPLDGAPQPAVIPMSRPVAVSVASPPVSGSRTPVIERLARAESRRRIEWAGKAIYLDSAFATPDSVLRRWNEHPEVRVAVLAALDNPALEAEARAALGEWRLVNLGFTLTEVADTNVADIVVHWIERFDIETAPVAGDGAGRTGLTEVQSNSQGEVGHATVTLAMTDPRGRRLAPLEVRAVAMHELGHALGLPHSADPRDIMYPTVRRATLSDRDRATATLLYALPPGPLREPTTP